MNETQIHQLAQRAYDLGFSYEKEYRGCAQCTLAGIQDALDMPNPDLFRAASALASGGGLTCAGSCGGFSGGLMFISSLLGRRRDHIDGDDEYKYTSFRMGQQLHDRFIQTHGSVICREIHQKLFGRTYDLYDAEDKKQFDDDGAHRDICTSVVAEAARWSVEILLEEFSRRGWTLESVREAHT